MFVRLEGDFAVNSPAPAGVIAGFSTAIPRARVTVKPQQTEKIANYYRIFL